jgi:class 3 adenylate cyclase
MEQHHENIFDRSYWLHWTSAGAGASRMESTGEPGRVNVSAYTYDLIRKEFECEYRGRVDAKGKGEVDMYFVAQYKLDDN